MAARRATAARSISCSTATRARPIMITSGSAGSRHSPDPPARRLERRYQGSEYFAIRVRDWTTKKDLDDVVEETDGAVVWSADSRAFFYCEARRQPSPAAGLAASPRHAAGR